MVTVTIIVRLKSQIRVIQAIMRSIFPVQLSHKITANIINIFKIPYTLKFHIQLPIVENLK